MNSVVQVAPNGVIIVNGDDVIQFCNHALYEMFRYDDGTLIGKQLEILLPDNLQTTHILHRDGYARAPETRLMGGKKILKGKRKTGELFPIEVGLSSDSLDGETYYFATIIDVTDRWLQTMEAEHNRKNLQRQVMDRTEDIGLALRTAEANSQFMARLLELVNHEFRTPLGSIIGYGELLELHLREMGSAQAPAVSYAAAIKDAGEDLLEIVRKVANMSIVSSGDLQASALPVALDRAVSDAVERIERVLNRQEIKVVTDWRDSVVPLADPTMFVRALAMLLENAALYGARGESVVVTARKAADGGCEISVVDTGMGLSEDERKSAIKPFERLERALGATSGLGLGLTIVQAYAGAMNGQLKLEPGEKGGMVATLVLPCAPDQH